MFVYIWTGTPGVLLIHTYVKLRFSSDFANEKRRPVDFLHSPALGAIACPTQHVQWASIFGRKFHESLIYVDRFKLISCFPLLLYGGATTRGCWTPNYLQDWTIWNSNFGGENRENIWITNMNISAIAIYFRSSRSLWTPPCCAVDCFIC